MNPSRQIFVITITDGVHLHTEFVLSKTHDAIKILAASANSSSRELIKQTLVFSRALALRITHLPDRRRNPDETAEAAARQAVLRYLESE